MLHCWLKLLLSSLGVCDLDLDFVKRIAVGVFNIFDECSHLIKDLTWEEICQGFSLIRAFGSFMILTEDFLILRVDFLEQVGLDIRNIIDPHLTLQALMQIVEKVETECPALIDIIL